MSETLHLTARDREIVQALVQKVRLFSQRQIVDHWWNGELANSRRRLKRLADRNLLHRNVVMARPAPSFESPLITWRPNDAAPDFGKVAYRCQARWRFRPARQCVVWLATEVASQAFGGTARGELKHPTQATHDLGVAAVWLRLHQVAPQWAAAWCGEDLMAHTRHGQKLPDAFIVDDTNQVIRVIEFGGGYDAERVEAFHQDCVSRNLPYQLW
jgi:hypothetical protein